MAGSRSEHGKEAEQDEAGDGGEDKEDWIHKRAQASVRGFSRSDKVYMG
jgi:hypothetical protein